VQRALTALTKNRTTISIAHRMVTARAADRILVFDHGRIVESGSHGELLDSDGVYSSLYRVWAASLPPRLERTAR
jgi:ATP-binding cassette subfamily B protein